MGSGQLSAGNHGAEAMFLDEATIDVKGGDGGKGIVAFRREKYVPRGGPNGGNGGRGGDVVLVADEGLNTLHAFRFTKLYEGGRGGHGGGSNCQGRRGEDLEVRIPSGTVVRDVETGAIVADMVEHGQRAVIARGGAGGRGNAAFKTSARRAPRFAELGEPGQERRLKLELKLLADVGLAGLPNAGKSTLLAAVSAARPKIADYPFTTLRPHLGVVDIGHESLVFADIPGLIEGASTGAGLGDRFLRHIERTRLLVHVLDASADDPLADFETVSAELAAFGSGLAERPRIVALNKMDVREASDRAGELESALAAKGFSDCVRISAAGRQGLDRLVQLVTRRVAELPAPVLETEADLPVLRPTAIDGEAFTITRDEQGEWHVRGPRAERAATVTDWNNEAAIERLQRVLGGLGVLRALREAGVAEGDMVHIGSAELEWTD